MSKIPLIQKLEEKQLQHDGRHQFRVGDTIKVHTRIVEGKKERIQVFTGTVIGRSGTGLAETFSLHRVAYGEGMERIFLLHSPRIAKIEVAQEGIVRRGKLYYLRGTSGKKARVKKRVGPARKPAAAAVTKPLAEEAVVNEPQLVLNNESNTAPAKEEKKKAPAPAAD